ncbi:MAG: recombinase family protein, partial [Defluviitaleaceae bacterium]|nr:recombinase family protein [Defluviitaleaceae bacterium]
VVNWYKSVVKRITENPMYLGRLVQGKYRTALMSGGMRIYTPESDWVVSEDTHPAIIDEATFEAVQELRQNRTKQYHERAEEANRPQASENIFKGLIFCGDCKRNLSRLKVVLGNGKVYYRFLCPTYEEVDRCKCTKKRLLESELLSLIHTFIDVQMQTLTDINRLIDDIRKQANYVNKMEMVDDSLSKAQKALARLTGIRSSLYEDYESGLLSKEDYLLVKKKYEAQHKELTNEIEALSKQKKKQTNVVAENKWAAAFSSFQHGKELSRELVTSIIERIDVSDTNDVAITVKYRDEQLALLTMLSEYAEYTAEGVAV